MAPDPDLRPVNSLGAGTLSNSLHVSAALRAAAVRVDLQNTERQSCRELWGSIRQGGVFVRDSFSEQGRAYLILQQRAAPVPACQRSLDVLERVLQSDSQKLVAIELGAASSTVASASRTALRAIGLEMQVSRVPPLLRMLVHAALVPGSTQAIRSTNWVFEGTSYSVQSIALRNATLSARLSPAEHDVALMRIEGHSLAEIARCRRTSRHTVANQLATAFRRLGITGRSNLVELFLRPT